MAKAKEASEQNQAQQQNQTEQANQQSTQGAEQQQQSQSGQQNQQSQQGMQQAGGGQNFGQNFGVQRRGASGFPSIFAMNPFQMMRMSPFQMMRLMTEEMDRMFDDFDPFSGGQIGQGQPQTGGQALQQTSGGQTGGALQSGRGFFGGALMSQPRVEVFERDNNLIVRADLPGMSPENVNIELTDNGLLIQGERRSENTDNQNGFYRSEVSYGSFRRLVPLPEGINAENATANFNNGVLEITLQAPQKQQSNRRIEIQGATGGSQPQAQTNEQTTQSQTGGEQSSAASE